MSVAWVGKELGSGLGLALGSGRGLGLGLGLGLELGVRVGVGVRVGAGVGVGAEVGVGWAAWMWMALQVFGSEERWLRSALVGRTGVGLESSKCGRPSGYAVSTWLEWGLG